MRASLLELRKIKIPRDDLASLVGLPDILEISQVLHNKNFSNFICGDKVYW